MKRFIAVLMAALFIMPIVFSVPVGLCADMGDDVIGMDLSSFSSRTITGSSVDGRIFSQKRLTVLHYFATWSSDCIEEMEFMQQAYREFGIEINVIGLLHEDATSTPQAALELAASLGITYPIVRLDEVLQSLVNKNPYIPQTFIVSSSGVVADCMIGRFSSYSVLEALINKHLLVSDEFHTVKFYDGLTGELLKTQTVPHGGSAVPPPAPTHKGYEFIGWDKSCENVTENRTITALYRYVGALPSGDVDGDGIVSMTDAVYVLRYALGLMQPGEHAMNGDMNGNGQLDVSDAVMIVRIAIGLA